MRIIIKYKNILIPPNNTPPLDNIPLPSPVGEGLGVRLGGEAVYAVCGVMTACMLSMYLARGSM